MRSLFRLIVQLSTMSMSIRLHTRCLTFDIKRSSTHVNEFSASGFSTKQQKGSWKLQIDNCQWVKRKREVLIKGRDWSDIRKRKQCLIFSQERCRSGSNLSESDMLALFYDACTDTLGNVHFYGVGGGIWGARPKKIWLQGEERVMSMCFGRGNTRNNYL